MWEIAIIQSNAKRFSLRINDLSARERERDCGKACKGFNINQVAFEIKDNCFPDCFVYNLWQKLEIIRLCMINNSNEK